MSSSEWSDPNLVNAYSDKAANPEVNWFEYEVNVPAMILLMPSNATKVLDFGCGAGDVTAMLKQKYPNVEGCDPSQPMLDLCNKDFPNLTFFKWDANEPLEDKNDYYDVVFSKLAMHFVEDLQPVANNLFSVLKQGGSLVFSVPHPISTVRKINGASYWHQTPYPTEIGSYGIKVTMIHRSLQDYIKPFVGSGFVLSEADEPQIPDVVAKKYNLTEKDLTLPKRINLKLTKPTEVQS